MSFRIVKHIPTYAHRVCCIKLDTIDLIDSWSKPDLAEPPLNFISSKAKSRLTPPVK